MSGLYFTHAGTQLAMTIATSFFQMALLNSGLSYSQAGLFQSLFQLVGLLGIWLLGRLADKLGRVKYLLMSSVIAGTLFFMPVCLSGNIVLIAIGTALAGFFILSFNSLTDTMTLNAIGDRSESYSRMRVCGSGAYVVLQLVVAFADFPDADSNREIALSQAALAGVMVAILLFYRETPASGSAGKKAGSSERQETGRWFDREFVIGMVCICVMVMAFSLIDKYIPVYIAEGVGLANSFGYFLAIQGSSEMVMMLVAGHLIQTGKAKPYHFFVLAALAGCVRLVIYAYLPTVFGLVLASGLHSFTFGGLHVAAVTFVERHVSRKRDGTGVSVYVLCGNNGIPSVLSSLIAGRIIDAYGFRTLFLSFTVFTLAAIVLLLVFRRTLAADTRFKPAGA